MDISKSNRYLLKMKFGNKSMYGMKIYDQEAISSVKKRLILMGADPRLISIVTFESIYN